jgi:hypothetical protein
MNMIDLCRGKMLAMIGQCLPSALAAFPAFIIG